MVLLTHSKSNRTALWCTALAMKLSFLNQIFVNSFYCCLDNFATKCKWVERQTCRL